MACECGLDEGSGGKVSTYIYTYLIDSNLIFGELMHTHEVVHYQTACVVLERGRGREGEGRGGVREREKEREMKEEVHNES